MIAGIARYRQIFTLATTMFAVTGLVARLPISMVGIGIVLLAEAETGSYAFTGAVSWPPWRSSSRPGSSSGWRRAPPWPAR